MTTKNPLPIRREGVEVNLGHAPTTFAAGTKLRPLRDGILVKVTQWRGSKILETPWSGRPLQGVAITVGNGCYPWKYNKDRSKRWPSKAFRKCDVQVGDLIDLGGLEMRGYPFPQLLIGNELHIMVREEDICIVLGSVKDIPANSENLPLGAPPV